MINNRWILTSLITFLVLSSSVLGKGSLPKWLASHDSIQQQDFDDDVESVVLHHEVSHFVESSGKIRKIGRFAVKIFDVSAANEATAVVRYRSDTDSVKSLNAWLQTPNGKVRRYGKKDVVDISNTNSVTLKSTSRTKGIYASDDASSDCVFAYEYEVVDQSISSQLIWSIQERRPVVLTRISIEHPSDWTLEERFFNHEPIEDTVSGSTRSWQVMNQPALNVEALSLSPTQTQAWAAFGLIAPTGAAIKIKREHWPDWAGFSSYYADEYFRLDEVSTELEKKVGELTSGMETTASKIRSLSEFAQSVNYVSISLELGSGGGSRPRSPDEVLNTKYGDCKDKSQLLRQMLSVIGIESFPVVVGSRSGGFVNDDWVSPLQFDHCILAISVDEGVNEPAVANSDQLGRLLLFDPTDEVTVFGDFRSDLQGGRGVLLAGNDGGVIDFPLLPSEASGIVRTISAELDAYGNLSGSIVENSVGQIAMKERGYRSSLERSADYSKWIRKWLGRYMPNVSIQNVKTKQDKLSGAFTLGFKLNAPAYGKSMGGRLLMFKPLVVNRANRIPVDEEERITPIQLAAYNLVENIELVCPDGYMISEVPSDLKLDTDFGSYEIRYTFDGGILRIERTKVVQKVVLQRNRCEEVREFYRKIVTQENKPVVLERMEFNKRT